MHKFVQKLTPVTSPLGNRNKDCIALFHVPLTLAFLFPRQNARKGDIQGNLQTKNPRLVTMINTQIKLKVFVLFHQ